MPLIITVIIIEILSGAEVDLFVPSFPEIQSVFGLTPFMVELMLCLNFCAYTFSAIILGALSDKYGTKPVIVYGLTCFILGSLCCILAPSYDYVLMGRVLQGIGIAGPSALAYVVIAQKYDVNRQSQIMGWLNGAITLAMAFAPVLGSYINLLFGWRANFTMLLLLAVLSLLAALFFIPKTKERSETSGSLKDYAPVFQSKPTMWYICAICFLVAPYWIFIGISPILYMGGFGVPLMEFGYYQGAIAFTFALLSFTSALMIKFFGTKRCFYTSMLICIIAIITILSLGITGTKSPTLITASLGLLSAGVIFPANILWPMALETLSGAKSKISATMLAAKLLTATIGLQFVSYNYDGTFFNIAMVIALGTSMALYSIWILVRRGYLVL